MSTDGNGVHTRIVKTTTTGKIVKKRNMEFVEQSQKALDELSVYSVLFLENLIMGNWNKLKLKPGEEAPLAVRLNAAKIVLDKAIANEKIKAEEIERERKAKEKPNSLPGSGSKGEVLEPPVVSSSAEG